MSSESDQPAGESSPDAGRPLRKTRDPRGYWWANLRLIAVLLTIWALVSFGVLLSANWLNGFWIGHLPLGFWIAQQGAIFVFVVLILVYAKLMDRIDREHGVEE